MFCTDLSTKLHMPTLAGHHGAKFHYIQQQQQKKIVEVARSKNL